MPPMVVCHECSIVQICNFRDARSSSYLVGKEGCVHDDSTLKKIDEALEKMDQVTKICPLVLLHGMAWSNYQNVKEKLGKEFIEKLEKALPRPLR